MEAQKEIEENSQVSEFPSNKSLSVTSETVEEKPRSLTWLYWILGVVILGGVAKLILGSRC